MGRVGSRGRVSLRLGLPKRIYCEREFVWLGCDETGEEGFRRLGRQ